MKEVKLPRSKSVIARLLVLEKLRGADFPRGLNDNDDIESMARVLRGRTHTVNAHGSATAARFAIAYYATRPGTKRVDGNEQLRRRPMVALVDALRRMGAHIEYLKEEGHLPVAIDGMADFPASVEIDGTESSQNISALMLVAADRGLTINVRGPMVSRSYVELTEEVMSYCSCGVRIKDSVITVKKSVVKSSYHMWHEYDWSSAAFWYAMVAVGAMDSVKMKDLRPSEIQPDGCAHTIFAALGVDTEVLEEIYKRSDPAIAITHSPILPVGAEETIDCSRCPDLALLLMATFSRLERPFTLTGLGVLANKESDRGRVMQRELRKLGYAVEFDGGTMAWSGAHCRKTCKPDTADDHRVAMALIVAGAKGVNTACIDKSYKDIAKYLPA